MLPLAQSGSLYQGGELCLRVIASSPHAHLSCQERIKNRSSKQKFPQQPVNLSWLQILWLCKRMGGSEVYKNKHSAAEIFLSPTNVWMPPDQIYHRRTAPDRNPPNNSFCCLPFPEVWESLFISGFD